MAEEHENRDTFPGWEVWLMHHPRAARKLLSRFQVEFEPRPATTLAGRRLPRLLLKLSEIPLVGERQQKFIEALLNREACEALLGDLGWKDWEDTASAATEERELYLAEKTDAGKTWEARFKGHDRWQAAGRWALERWEKQQASSQQASKPGGEESDLREACENLRPFLVDVYEHQEPIHDPKSDFLSAIGDMFEALGPPEMESGAKAPRTGPEGKPQ